MMEKPKSRSNSSENCSQKSADSRSYSIDSFSSAVSSNEDLPSLDSEEKDPYSSSTMQPIPMQAKLQNYMKIPCRRKRESGYQAQSKSPSVEHVLNTIFRNKTHFHELFKKKGVK